MRYFTLALISILCPFLSFGQDFYVPLDQIDGTHATIELGGGSFQSFGCGEIDPTYWLNGTGEQFTVTFNEPQTNPYIRVWGMNDDDWASVQVNGVDFSMNDETGSYNEKIVCAGQPSPGPNGVWFEDGFIKGFNDNSAGNYSYQDVTVIADNVTSIRIYHEQGAGWGVDGIGNNGPTSDGIEIIDQKGFSVYPNPFQGEFYVSPELNGQAFSLVLIDILGKVVFQKSYLGEERVFISVPEIPSGVYLLQLRSGNVLETKRIVKR